MLAEREALGHWTGLLVWRGILSVNNGKPTSRNKAHLHVTLLNSIGP